MERNNFLTSNIPLVKAIIFSIISIFGIIITVSSDFDLTESLWLFITILFLSIGISGETKKDQLIFFTKFTFFSILFILIGYYISKYISQNTLLYYPIIFSVTILSFILLEKINQIKNVSHLLIYLILLSGKNFGDLNIFSYILPCFLGYILSSITILILPKFSFPYKHKEYNKEELIRFFRVSLAVIIVLFLSNYYHLFNPIWSALTVLMISQGTLGETIKKSIYRLSGTFFGIIVGIIASIYLFEPYEYSRFLILVLFFLGILSLQRSYTQTIFFFTIGLCGLSFIAFHSSEEFLEFIVGRFVDTVLGILVLILLELTIFPYSVIKEIRKFRKEYWVLIHKLFSKGDIIYFENNITKANEFLDNSVNILKEYRYEPVSLFNKNYKYQREYFAQVIKINKIINTKYKELLEHEETKDYIVYIAYFLSKLNLKNLSKSNFENMKPIPDKIKNTDLENAVNKIVLVYEHFIKEK